MILVTGAAGKTGRHVIRRLGDMGTEVRALVRTPEQIGPLLDSGARAAVPGDLLKAEDVSRAFDGVRAVYHICPNIHPREVEIGDVMIAAARTAGVDRFVFHSVLLPDVEAMPHHWLKFQVERRLAESGLSFSILRPCAYMQNLSVHVPQMTQRGRLEVPYDVEAKFSLVDLRDVAECAATVLTEPGHEGRTYGLCGPEAISHTFMARAFESALGRPVDAVSVDPAAWERKARSSGLGDYAVDALTQMFRWYDRNGFVGSSEDLESLLARPAHSFAD
ncbi:MAG: NmrA family NAD(P)-binding protein, partial [Gemmatimonadetes bacterium]|nr:NmrA family NAD(P)-binding protein [Gemmatimonadota bacterium]